MEKLSVGDTKQPVVEIVGKIEQREWWRAIRMRDIMSTPVICVDSATTVTEAHQLMHDRKIRRLPVIDNGVLVGMLTQGDVRGAMPSEVTTLNRAEQNYLIQQLKIERVMSRDVIVATENMTLADAARLLVQYKIGGLPVVTEDNVVGIVTESDIFGIVVAMIDKLDQI